MDNEYEIKYLKYKKKYLRLKHKQTGGEPFMVNLGIHLQKLPFGSYFAKKATNYCEKYRTTDDAINRINKFAQDYDIKPSTIEQCKLSNIPDTNLLECWAKFKTPNDFFIRKRINLPQIKSDDTLIVSPCDSYCIYLHQTNTNVWIKGQNFSLDKLLFDKQLPDFIKTTDYELLIFRLAPQHYHRFHSPVSGKILKISKYGTKYFSVNPIIVNSSIDVYTENVRIIIEIKMTNNKIVWLAIIGATCIGSIELTHEKTVQAFNKNYHLKLETISDKLINQTIDLSNDNILIQINQELGYFQYGGSTVVLIFTKNDLKLTKLGLRLQSNQEIELKVGDSLFE